MVWCVCGGIHSIIKMIYMLIYAIFNCICTCLHGVKEHGCRLRGPDAVDRLGGRRHALQQLAGVGGHCCWWCGVVIGLVVNGCVYVCVLCMPPNTHTTNNKNPTHQSARSQSRGRAPAAPRPRGKGSGGNPHRGRPSATRHGASARRVSRGRTRPSRGAGWACRRRRVGRAPKGGDCLGVGIL